VSLDELIPAWGDRKVGQRSSLLLGGPFAATPSMQRRPTIDAVQSEMPFLHQREPTAVVGLISPIFDEVAARYSEEKYPTEPYAEFKRSFAANVLDDDLIKRSLLWKYGKYNAGTFPERHRASISRVTAAWPAFVASEARSRDSDTFNWWRTTLPRTSYITAAYVTHLVHHVSVPIIDQHNFRAMNYLTASVRPGFAYRKKPSSWNDIVDLGEFISAIRPLLGCSVERLDRFLMMYGRDEAPR